MIYFLTTKGEFLYLSEHLFTSKRGTKILLSILFLKKNIQKKFLASTFKNFIDTL